VRLAFGKRHTGTERYVGHQAGAVKATVLGHNAQMDLALRDRAYVVTGGSRGLGFAGAKALVAEAPTSSSPSLTRPRPPRQPIGSR
jgi:hypothetical protein